MDTATDGYVEDEGVQYDFTPQGPILDAYIRCRARVSLIRGPLGSGKTTASCWKMFDLICEQRPSNGVRRSRWIVVRNTYPDLMGTTAKDWLDMCGDLGDFVQGGLEPPTHYLNCKLEDGTYVEAEIVFMALDKPAHVKKLRGVQATGIYLSEVKEIPRAVVDMLDLRHGRYPSLDDGGPSWHGMIGDTNSCDDDHWYFAMETESTDSEWQFFVQPGGVLRMGYDEERHVIWQVNPSAENLRVLDQVAPGYYEKGMVNKTDDWIAVNLANEFGTVADGRPVYPDYRDHAHCKPFELRPEYGGILVGADFGLTPAAVFAQRTASGVWYKRKEIVTEDCTIETFAELVLLELQTTFQMYQLEGCWGDPAGVARDPNRGQTAIQIFQNAGIPMRAAPTNSPTIRVEAVNSYFKKAVNGEPAMYVHPQGCPTLRKAYKGGYVYQRVQVVGEQRYQDSPLKNRYSHVADADQYLMIGAGEGRTVTKGNRRIIRLSQQDGRPRPTRARMDDNPFGD